MNAVDRTRVAPADDLAGSLHPGGATPHPIRLNLAGVAGIAFFAIYFVSRLPAGEPQSALWACHLASLLAGAGILMRRSTCIAIGVLWLLVGIPMWFLFLAIGGSFHWASLLTHFGGLAVGCFGLKALGMPRGIWWKAMAGLLILLGASRQISPPELNVNLSYHVYQSFDPFIGYYAAAIAGLTAGTSVFFIVAERGLYRIFPHRATPYDRRERKFPALIESLCKGRPSRR